MIYLDHAATSPLLPAVKQRLHELIDLDLGNASALHSPGQFSKDIIEESRAQIAKLINARPEEIIFTSGGSESNNAVMATFAHQNITVSSIEHPSVLESAKFYASKLKLIPVDRWGRVNPEEIPQDVNLVSVMLANNELGTIEPIQEIAKRCKNYNTFKNSNQTTNSGNSHKTYIHTDATQALGKIPIDVQELGVDYLTISAHKIGGPLGIGALYVRTGAPFTSLIRGGHQENKRRAGTSNALAIAGFGTAAQYVHKHRTYQEYAEKIRPLRDQLKQRILARIPYSSSNTPDEDCLPNILNMSFRAAEGESIQLYLDAAGIVVSTGSACAAGDVRPSHVLMATHHDAEVAHSSIRFSLGLDTTQQEMDEVMKVLPDAIARLQGISTIKLGDENE